MYGVLYGLAVEARRNDASGARTDDLPDSVRTDVMGLGIRLHRYRYRIGIQTIANTHAKKNIAVACERLLKHFNLRPANEPARLQYRMDGTLKLAATGLMLTEKFHKGDECDL